jgi:hypothetical protein
MLGGSLEVLVSYSPAVLLKVLNDRMSRVGDDVASDCYRRRLDGGHRPSQTRQVVARRSYMLPRRNIQASGLGYSETLILYMPCTAMYRGFA